MTSIKTKYELDAFQSQACEFIDNNFNVLVSAPTGSGKTAIAEYAIEKTKILYPSNQIIYTCPIKSLCNEKYRDMVNSHASAQTNYSIGLMTGDIVINPEGDIIIMTTEVLLNLISNKEKEFQAKCVIFDEVHYINDDGRGHVWEKCIVYSLQQQNVLLVLLSATIGNIDSMLNWLNSIDNSKQFKKIVKTERPVPLREFLIDNSKIRVLKKNLDDDEKITVSDDPAEEMYELLPLTNLNYIQVKKYWDKLEEYNYSIKFELQTLCNQIASNPNLGIPAIIFVLSKVKCIEYAEMCTSVFVNHEEQSEIIKFYDKNLKEYETNSQYINLRKTISKGVAYHHSGLIPKIREVVEFLIKSKLVKIVFATETFAVGLNFPVKTVVLTSLSKPTENGFRNLYVSEYKQMAGRAGRRFLDNFGNVILWLYNDKIKTKYPYPSWGEINAITSGPVDSVSSKYIIEPNFILKNLESYKIMSDKSFRYYNFDKSESIFKVPEKFEKIFEMDKKVFEFANQGISFIDKNYKKLISKLSKDELVDYKKFYELYKLSLNKNDYQIYLEKEANIITFLNKNDFITKLDNKWITTTKGELALNFNEINPVLFVEHMNRILQDPDEILPILSMFIDDGFKLNEDEPIPTDIEIIDYFNKVVKTQYPNYTNILPKWTFYPLNYVVVKVWLSNESISLDEINLTYGIDMGLMVKILIKMYQITEELLTKLIKINRVDLNDFLIKQKELLIRYPIKLESLYVNN